MPIYEYICRDCGARFESMRTMREADQPISCKVCLSPNTYRTVSVFFAASEGRAITNQTGCASCGGGSCASCGHH